jgi:hypothetical protein
MIQAARAFALAGAIAANATAFAAAPPPQFVQFSPSATKGALYRPDPAAFPHPTVGVVVMHRNSNYLSHISTRELPARGFIVLGMNPRCDNNEAACAPWENNALDVKSGVNYLRNTVGVSKVVLLGHSGGGPTMSFYQAVAEKGVAFCQQPEKLVKCASTLAGLPKADGLILMDAHPGNGINAVRSVNPSVTNDEKIIEKNDDPKTDRKLDPFAADNGYLSNGQTRYSESFKRKAFKAQSERMNELIELALERLAEVESKGYGDGPFIVPMADNARMADIDVSIHHSTVQPRKLVKNDGTVDTRIVESVRVANLTPADAVGFGATMFLTLRSFLSVRAVRSNGSSMDGIQWCSSNNSTNCNLQQVSVPLLVTTMGGHYFIRDGEVFFDMAASADKDYYVIEGATHGGTPCTACSAVTGQSYANATKNLFDLMRDWMSPRF